LGTARLPAPSPPNIFINISKPALLVVPANAATVQTHNWTNNPLKTKGELLFSPYWEDPGREICERRVHYNHGRPQMRFNIYATVVDPTSTPEQSKALTQQMYQPFMVQLWAKDRILKPQVHYDGPNILTFLA